MDRRDIDVNRRSWDAYADEYQQRNRSQIAPQMTSGDITWGIWGIPESEMQILGDVEGKRVLEFGCGAAQWSIALARRGASPFAFDLSFRQLEHARASMAETGIFLPIVQAAAEEIPFTASSFDIVFADYGAFTFADPLRTIPHASRVLRRGGLLAFVNVHPILSLAWSPNDEYPSERFVTDYFDLFRTTDEDGSHDYQLPLSRWVELFTEAGLVIEKMIETRPRADARSSYRDDRHRDWARRWPQELIWVLRKR